MHEPLIAGKVLVMLLGFVVASRAYAGYRRHGSTAMAYLAVGFALISVGTAIEGLLFELTALDIYLAGTVQTAVAAAGMLAILYSLYGEHTTRFGRPDGDRPDGDRPGGESPVDVDD